MTRTCECGGIIDGETCDRCGPKVKRSKPSELHGDYKWRKLSERFRKANPLCHDCEQQGLVRPSQEVHHIKKATDYPALKYEWRNLMALCHRCHQKRTTRGE